MLDWLADQLLRPKRLLIGAALCFASGLGLSAYLDRALVDHEIDTEV